MNELTLKVEKFGVKIQNYEAEFPPKRNLDEDSLRKIFDLFKIYGQKGKQKKQNKLRSVGSLC